MVACVNWLRVRIWSDTTAPEIVSRAKIEMTASVRMLSLSCQIVAENVKAWRIFKTTPGNDRGRGLSGNASRRNTGYAGTLQFPPATQLHSRRVPSVATRPSRHIGLVINSQKQTITANNARLNHNRTFMSAPPPRYQHVRRHTQRWQRQTAGVRWTFAAKGNIEGNPRVISMDQSGRPASRSAEIKRSRSPASPDRGTYPRKAQRRTSGICSLGGAA